MTTFDRFDRRLGDALDDLASPQFPDYFDDVLAVAVSHRQRPAWTFLGRWIPVSTLTRRSVLVPGVPWRTVGILLVLLALLVAGAVISIGLRLDRNPAPPFGPAANGLIAYAAGGDLYTRDFTTGAETLLVGGSATDVFPTFSRDGLSLAWFRLEPDEADGATLMVANADGTAARSLLGPALIDSMAWSPTSDAVAVISAPAGAERTLSVVPIGSGEEARTIELPVVPKGSVEWRPPDGRELIFLAADGVRHAIHAVGVDGSGYRQVSATGGVYSFTGSYHLTPDGSRMLYADTSGVVEIRILDLETREERIFGAELPPPPDFDGGLQHHGMEAILPDGETILFGRYWNESGELIDHQLYVGTIDADGADAVAVGPVHRSQSGHNPFWTTVSPDGAVILIVENDTFVTWVARPDGGAPEQVEWGELADPPAWQRVAP